MEFQIKVTCLVPNHLDMYTEYDFLIVGAGIVGPALAVGLAKHGRKVLVLERSLEEPDRIVGELLQPGGIEALRDLGMGHAVDGIDAIPIEGYAVLHKGSRIDISYPEFCDQFRINENTKTGDVPMGRGFHHGKFVQNLRKIAQEHPNVTFKQATVLNLIKNDSTGHVLGVTARTAGGDLPFFAKLTMLCDGTNSKFRSLVNAKPRIDGYFVGLVLKDASLVAPNRGHVIIGDKHKPILIYQIGTGDARILCDVPAPLPSVASGALRRYLETNCLPYLPEQTQPAFAKALETQQLRSMPNQWLTAANQDIPGAVMVGDALNMRHPLTGGGMTAGLRDAVLLSSLLGPLDVNITDRQTVRKLVRGFTAERKHHAAVINILSIALYRLFSGANYALAILQAGCFRYFEFGGLCVRDPAALLAGLLASPQNLFYHFFAVAFWAIYYNFAERGLLLAPVAIVEGILTLFTAIWVFLPVFLIELS